ncbi:MAG: hypothetical protein JEZ00_15350 [Anaerolineaceae bacterium]|nr:hypothetical protein [Anaerolineaceae bacterium]
MKLFMNRAEKEMSDWLAHPMEFGEHPHKIKQIHSEKTDWPLFDEPVKLAFHHFVMKDGYNSIGMTGPATWTFLEDDMRDFSIPEIKRLYAGWYICFMALRATTFSTERTKKRSAFLAAELASKIKGFIEILDYINFGDLTFYAYKIQEGDDEIVVASNTKTTLKFPAGSKYLRLPPLFYFIGHLFFEGQL